MPHLFTRNSKFTIECFHGTLSLSVEIHDSKAIQLEEPVDEHGDFGKVERFLKSVDRCFRERTFVFTESFKALTCFVGVDRLV